MAELPEIAKLAGQMNDELKGRVIAHIEIVQEKCTNVPVAELDKRTRGAKITAVFYKGKWIIISLGNGESILLSLGMGGDLLHFKKNEDASEKYQVKALMADGSGFTVRFWWFGKFLLASRAEMETEPNTAEIALDPFDKRFTVEYFLKLARGKKTQVKAFLMNQKNIGGIGNMYMHDILFKSGLHPQARLADVDEKGLKKLYLSIIDIFELSRSKGAFSYEMDFYGVKGGYGMEDFLIGYKEGQPCPACGGPIEQVKAGGSSSYICPVCQKIKK